MKYRVSEATSVDLDAGRVRCDFPAGDCSPKNDSEREALEHLVSIGLAERVRAAAPAKE